MTKKEKPRLHATQGNSDPELYSDDLAWYFGCFDSVAGLRSCAGSFDQILAMSAAGSRKSMGEDGEPIQSTVHVSSGGDAGRGEVDYTGRIPEFTRARRIYGRFCRLPWMVQEVLAEFYTPRKYFPVERKPLDESMVRWAHKTYYGFRA